MNQGAGGVTLLPYLVRTQPILGAPARAGPSAARAVSKRINDGPSDRVCTGSSGCLRIGNCAGDIDDHSFGRLRRACPDAAGAEGEGDAEGSTQGRPGPGSRRTASAGPGRGTAPTDLFALDQILPEGSRG